MSRYMLVNLNDTVKVKLTEKGRQILKDEHEALKKRFPSISEYKEKEVDKSGYTQFQLWSLIKTFGPSIYLGCDVPFETTIMIEEH